MIDKAIFVMIFMYIMSFSFLSVQYIFFDLIGGQITDFEGNELKSYFILYLNTGNINEVASRVSTGTYTQADATALDKFVDFSIAAAYIAWDFITILTGTYVFNILLIFGLPQVFVTGIAVVYIFLLMRSIVALIRGV